MKTVPSGRFDFCMKAAPAVSGTFMSGIPTPAIVGRAERRTGPSWEAVRLACVVELADEEAEGMLMVCCLRDTDDWDVGVCLEGLFVVVASCFWSCLEVVVCWSF